MLSALMRLAEISADKVCGLRRYAPGKGSPPRIVSHRGAWNRSDCLENTLPAFERAKELGAWGIELDVRFTSDKVAVVHHDDELGRVFGKPGHIGELEFLELRATCPGIPRLAEVLLIQDLHFMIEIKTRLGAPEIQVLAEELGGKIPQKDYHLLAFEPSLVHEHEKLPARAWILVGELDLRSRLELTLSKGYAGLAGHYLAMGPKIISRLHANGQKAGVGFTPNKNLLHREWARGVDYVFTNSTSRLF